MILQYIIIALVVFTAVFWLIKRLLPSKKGEAGCPGCSACGSIRVPEED